MANRAYWQKLSAEKNIPALAKRMGWRVFPNSEPASSDKPKPTLRSVSGWFVSEDELNRRALAESIAYFSSHPELLQNYKRVPVYEDRTHQEYCVEHGYQNFVSSEDGLLCPICGDIAGDPSEQTIDVLEPEQENLLQSEVGNEVLSIDMGRQASQEELAAIAGALRTLIRYHSRKV